MISEMRPDHVFFQTTTVPPFACFILLYFFSYNLHFHLIHMLILSFSFLFCHPFPIQIHFFICNVNISSPLIPLPPSTFFPLPLSFFCDVSELNYSILRRLLILLIEPITFCMDQCRKGNDLNDCRIKPHNYSNWCKGTEGGRDRGREEEGARKENGLAEGGKLISSLTQACMIQHVRLSASFCPLASTWCVPQCESVQGDRLSEPTFCRDYLKCMGCVETGSV